MATDEEIKGFSMPCPRLKMEKSVSPITCRNCDGKKTCPQVQGLLGADREYGVKFKGTILEAAMRRIGRTKKEIAAFILETP